jgi:hypothetical protein
MLYKALNKTFQSQQIQLIDGSALTVQPDQEIEIDEFKIYKEEFERIKRFFKITQVAFKDIPRRITKKNVEPESDFNEEVK